MKFIKHFKSLEYFTTERLIAKKIVADDVNKLIELQSHPEVVASLRKPYTNSKNQENLDLELKQWQDNEFGLWLFYLKDTHQWIGGGGLKQVILNGLEEIELVYVLLPAYWHQGYATEIANACVEIAFDVLRLNHMISCPVATNIAAQKVLKKAGFHFEKETIIQDADKNLPHLLYRIQHHRKAEVVSYHSDWPILFHHEAAQIKTLLGQLLYNIHHIGSTAIPGIAAKPIIDIMIEVQDLNQIETIKQQLHLLGYLYFSRQVMPHRSFFTRRKSHEITFHLHIYEKGDPQIKRHVDFRDYLIAHPSDAQDYVSLKLQLAKQFQNSIYHYTAGKNQLVQQIDAKAKKWKKNHNHHFTIATKHSIQSLPFEAFSKAIVANFNLYITYFAQYLTPITFSRMPGSTLINTGLHHKKLNIVLDIHFSKAEANKKIDEITNYFTEKKLPFSWLTSPFDKPDDLNTRLLKKGYLEHNKAEVLYVNLDDFVLPTDYDTKEKSIRIIQANDKNSLLDFSNLNMTHQSYFQTYFSWLADIVTPDDPIEYFIGYDDHQAIAGGAICYYAGIAGIYCLSSANNQDHASHEKILLSFLLNRIKKLGYHIAIFHIPEKKYASYHNNEYKKTGLFFSTYVLNE